ncbi:hypothetical protein BH11CYA1_BH11CYA1_12090 [soil metagenome]
MYSSKKKMTIGRVREVKPTLRVPTDTSKSPRSSDNSPVYSSGNPSAVNKIGKTSKALSYSSSTDFVRAVETDNNSVGFVKHQEQRLPTDFSWDKLMPEKWNVEALHLPTLKEWWHCPSGRTILIGVFLGLVIVAATAATERVTADGYSEEGRKLLSTNPQQAISYFGQAAISESSRLWTGAPRHVAALEGLALAYERAGYKESALETLSQECQMLNKAPVKDDFRLASALGVYAECLERNGRSFEANNVRTRINNLRDNKDGVLIVLLVLASLATFGIYAANALLQDKLHLSNWRVYFWFTSMWYFGFVACALHIGIGLLPALVISVVAEYAVLPAFMAGLVAMGQACAPIWSHCITSATQRSVK